MQRKNGFKKECSAYLDTMDHHVLRALGRHFGVQHPTKKIKEVLIKEIVAILLGELAPTERSNRGAPVKNDTVDEKCLAKIEELKLLYLVGVGVKTSQSPADGVHSTQKSASPLTIDDFGKREKNSIRVENSYGELPVYVGQLQNKGGISYLYGMDGRETVEKVVVTVDQIRSFDLRDGDVIECHAEKSHGLLVMSEVLKLNDLPYKKGARGKFDSLSVVYPTERVCFGDHSSMSVTEKYLDWFLPVGKGQRAIVSASLKSGKTYFLKELAKSLLLANVNAEVMVLLIDQSPETVSEFSSVVKKENFVHTSFEDEDDDHVFAAEFLLKRAKRYAESGKDVFLIVDSLTALARAYNATTLSEGGKRLACGLESKTLRYLKNYLGAARNFEKSGSLAIFASLSVGSGDPADETLYAELSSASNMLITLSGKLAVKRIFPALDLSASHTERSDLLFDGDEEEKGRFILGEYLPKFGQEKLYALVEECDTLSALYSATLAQLSK